MSFDSNLKIFCRRSLKSFKVSPPWNFPFIFFNFHPTAHSILHTQLIKIAWTALNKNLVVNFLCIFYIASYFFINDASSCATTQYFIAWVNNSQFIEQNFFPLHSQNVSSIVSFYYLVVSNYFQLRGLKKCKTTFSLLTIALKTFIFMRFQSFPMRGRFEV